MLRVQGPKVALLAVTVLLALSTAAAAQTTTSSASSSPTTSVWTGTSSQMWGGGSILGVNSSTMHSQEGTVAAEVNAAKQGILLSGGPGMTIQAIGSETIVNTTVYGSNNSTNVTANQTATNSGSISNSGSIASNP